MLGSIYFFRDKKMAVPNKNLSFISGFCLALVPIGILFKIMRWGFGEQYLIYSMVSLPVIFFVTFYLNSKANDELKTYYKNMLIRIGVMAVLAFVFYLKPTKTVSESQVVIINEIIIPTNA